MTCDNLQSLLHGYVDGELDLVHHFDIEQHLAGCPNCQQACQQLRVLQAELKGESFHFSPPPHLRRRITNSVRDLDESSPSPRRSWPWLALAAAALILFAISTTIYVWPAAENDRLEREVVASHVRSLMIASHLYDVESSDQHTVKPWFHGKVDFAPAVRDFAEEGFPLTGGRLEYLNNRPATALIYHRRKHIINLFIWPSAQTADELPRSSTRQGYQLVHWTHGGMTYWAVSDLNDAELRAFAELWFH